MDKNILFGVVAIDEAISALHIEPLDGARNFFSCKQNANGRKETNENANENQLQTYRSRNQS